MTMEKMYKDEVDENGYPLDKGCLEIGLPSSLQESIDKMKIVNQMLEEGRRNFLWDGEWCELNSEINVCEVDGIISSDQAWYLREKYLGMRKEDNTK